MLSTVFLLMSWLIVFVAADESVLELGQNCGKRASIRNSLQITPTHPMITGISKARTDVECLSSCAFPSCTAAYFNSNGDCYSVRGINGSEAQQTEGVPSGSLMEYDGILPNGECGLQSCTVDEVCVKSCQDKEFDSPVCLKADRHNCDLSLEYSNVRYYWSPEASDSRDTGSVMFVTYPKLKSETGLRVILHLDVRSLNGPMCSKWYLTFDNNICSSPHTIEQMDYRLASVDGNLHQTMNLDGTCYDLSSGDVRIDLVVGPCANMGTSEAWTGWKTVRTMAIMEVPSNNNSQDDPVKPCPFSVTFNYKYHSWVENLDVTQDFSQSDYLIKSFMYTKLADDSKLRMKYSALTGAYVSAAGGQYGGRWFLTINGTECDPKIDYIIAYFESSQQTYWLNHLRVRTVEGICQDSLPAGRYEIGIHMGAAANPGLDQPTQLIAGSFDTPSRLMVEEVRLDTAVDAIYGPDKHLYSSYIANLQYYSWTALNNDGDDGVLLTVTFEKKYESTALRLTSSGVHRQKTNEASHDTKCAKWYFKIDDSGCTDPGAIEGMIHFRKNTNAHMPIQVSGICYGVTKGTHTIQYATGPCYTLVSDTFTGFDSSFHIFAEEWRLDLRHTCSSNPVNCGP